MLEVRIANGTEEIYRLEIRNTTPARKKGDPFYKNKRLAAYTATLWGPSLPKPLVVRLYKFNRELGAIKLLNRVLGRFFLSYMDQLVNLKEKDKP